MKGLKHQKQVYSKASVKLETKWVSSNKKVRKKRSKKVLRHPGEIICHRRASFLTLGKNLPSRNTNTIVSPRKFPHRSGQSLKLLKAKSKTNFSVYWPVPCRDPLAEIFKIFKMHNLRSPILTFLSSKMSKPDQPSKFNARKTSCSPSRPFNQKKTRPMSSCLKDASVKLFKSGAKTKSSLPSALFFEAIILQILEAQIYIENKNLIFYFFHSLLKAYFN